MALSQQLLALCKGQNALQRFLNTKSNDLVMSRGKECEHGVVVEEQQ